MSKDATSPFPSSVSPANWRPALLARLRALILAADPDMVEVVKWRKPTNPAGVPVFEHDGIVCTGETYKDKVKLTFARGAALPDPAGLFNSGFAGGTRRAIDFPEGATIDEEAFKALVRAAVALNVSKKPKASAAGAKKAKPSPSRARTAKPAGAARKPASRSAAAKK